jgi:hypothetical protein
MAEKRKGDNKELSNSIVISDENDGQTILWQKRSTFQIRNANKIFETTIMPH